MRVVFEMVKIEDKMEVRWMERLEMARFNLDRSEYSNLNAA